MSAHPSPPRRPRVTRRRLPTMTRRRLERAQRDGVPRVPVPPLGTTWYDRGFAYWALRGWFAAMMLIAVVLSVTFARIIVIAAWESNRAAGVAIGSVIAITGLVSGVWIWRRSTPQAIEERARQATTKADPRGAGAGAGILGATAMAGNMLATAVIFVGASLMLGVTVVFFLRSLGRELPQERAERVLLGLPLG